jgi:hypothetical protein
MKPAKLAFAILAGLLDEYGTLVTSLEGTSEKMLAKEMLLRYGVRASAVGTCA